MIGPLVLIAIGSVALLALENSRAVVGALLVQWLGIAWSIALLSGGVGGLALVEIATALACAGILGVTVWNEQGSLFSFNLGVFNRAKHVVEGETQERQGISDALWLWAIVLVGGVAGFGLARLSSLGIDETTWLAVYWVLLSAVLALVVQGTRDMVKLSVGLLALANATTLLFYALNVGSPAPVTVALLSLVRISLATALAYAWLVLKAVSPGLDLSMLFDLRSGTQPLSTALALVTTEAEQTESVDEQVQEETLAKEEPEPAIEEPVEEPTEDQDQEDTATQ